LKLRNSPPLPWLVAYKTRSPSKVELGLQWTDPSCLLLSDVLLLLSDVLILLVCCWRSVLRLCRCQFFASLAIVVGFSSVLVVCLVSGFPFVVGFSFLVVIFGCRVGASFAPEPVPV
jgi:uncharacterized membrane-anchored protein